MELFFFLVLVIGCAAASTPPDVGAKNASSPSLSHVSEASINIDGLINRLLALDPVTGADVMNQTMVKYRATSNAPALNKRVARKSGGPLAVVIPRNAGETGLLGISALKGVPKQITLTIVQVNNLLSSLGLARTLFLMDSSLLLELSGCFAYCKEDRACLAAAQECEPASLSYIDCLNDAGNLVSDYVDNQQTSSSYSTTKAGYASTLGQQQQQGYNAGGVGFSSLSSPFSPQYGGLSPYQFPAFYPQYAFPYYSPFQPSPYGGYGPFAPSSSYPTYYGQPNQPYSTPSYSSVTSSSTYPASNTPDYSSTSNNQYQHGGAVTASSSYATPVSSAPASYATSSASTTYPTSSASTTYPTSPTSASYASSPAPASTQYKRAVQLPPRKFPIQRRVFAYQERSHPFFV